MTTMIKRREYIPSEIEPTWQTRWAEDRLSEIDVERAVGDRKFYNLVEFPYPSAEGLHVGHAYTYSGADTYGRYLRMRGREVFQPIGFDSFGIHTENYALRVGEHPRTLIERTIANYRRSHVTGCGLGLEPRDRNQRSLLLPLDAVDLRAAVQGWTGRSPRGPGRVVSVLPHRTGLRTAGGRPLRALRYPGRGANYAPVVPEDHRLRGRALRGLDDLDWPESAKRAQRLWIGRSEGVEIIFEVPDRALRLRAFTTRPDTLFGVTFLVIPPEHPDVKLAEAPAWSAKSTGSSTRLCVTGSHTPAGAQAGPRPGEARSRGRSPSIPPRRTEFRFTSPTTCLRHTAPVP